ncbi:zinc-binding alcohol dehydrogenase family protein [Cyanobium sp. NIES-981]|uniref:zinc-binding alcohol dehydrogenase family protein n=1 Tax=Cyanobium sp. NIES-981 TaxID=1851505 RepID=UPI0007DD90EB|nr:zinc-binding alcohol dehydrogenase family protein [Cyanobium sp. NIES-981]SBO42181.1 Alginate lyase [Cyanobium sp. NIES-981]
MRAVGYQRSAELGSPHYLLDLELPEPQPGEHDLLVRLEAVAVNPVDLKVRQREVPPAGGWRVLGWDAVGRVQALGSAVSGFTPGERVWYAGSLPRQGSNAELQRVDHRLVAAAPGSLSAAEAAALPLTAITAWELLFDRLRLPQHPEAGHGQALLVVGAAGGVGSILVQLLRALTGLTVVGTASRPESRAWVLALGAHHVLNHQLPLRPQLEALGIGGVEWAVGLTHTDRHFEALVDVLRPQGALALIDDPDPAALNLLALKRKSLSLHWEFMFTRSLFGTADMAEQGRLLQRLADLVEGGLVRSTLQDHRGRINAANLESAHRQLASGHSLGKVVLEGF